MKKIIEIIIYFVFSILIFMVLWTVTGEVWEKFVPLNDKTNLIALFVIPIIVILSFVLTSLTFHFIRKSD